MNRLTPLRALTLAAVVGLLVAMVLDTTFLDPAEQSAAQSPTFSPAEYVDAEFDNTAALIEDAAVDLPELAAALADDEAAASAEFGVESGTNKFVFAVRVTGVVAEVDDRFIIVDIAEMADADVRIPLSTALNGAPIRDVTDTVSFGDFANQTEYQQVANEYKLTVQELVLEPLDLDALGGSTIEVVGAWTTGGPPDTYIIHPVRIEVADD